MPCHKRPLVKNWDKPRKLRAVTPSRYEKNEASVKVHWKKVVKDMELFYKDDQFWDSQCETVRELVGPIIFKRIAKIFNLPLEAMAYEPKSEEASITPSEKFYIPKAGVEIEKEVREEYSISDFDPFYDEDDYSLDEQSEQWSISSQSSHPPSMENKKSFAKSISKTNKSQSKYFSKTLSRTYSSKSKSFKSEHTDSDESTSSDDSAVVQFSRTAKRASRYHKVKNPHYEMLYCNKSETDMIKWKSNYKVKVFEVSASDEFSKKAEILAKQISKDFYDWWVSLGNVEFKSEIKRPEDIEDLFQVWFDEHASHGLVLDPKILPCVLHSITKYISVPQSSCPKVLKRQIAADIIAESTPAHTKAFGTCLPQRMKHIPPKNNTEKIWHCVKIPEDLRTMSYVWEDISHLTSTKAFQKWLEQRPHLPMPQCLKVVETSDKKQLFVVPSDYVVHDKSASSGQDLALPVSQFSLELKEVLSKLMNQ